MTSNTQPTKEQIENLLAALPVDSEWQDSTKSTVAIIRANVAGQLAASSYSLDAITFWCEVNTRIYFQLQGPDAFFAPQVNIRRDPVQSDVTAYILRMRHVPHPDTSSMMLEVVKHDTELHTVDVPTQLVPPSSPCELSDPEWITYADQLCRAVVTKVRDDVLAELVSTSQHFSGVATTPVMAYLALSDAAIKIAVDTGRGVGNVIIASSRLAASLKLLSYNLPFTIIESAHPSFTDPDGDSALVLVHGQSVIDATVLACLHLALPADDGSKVTYCAGIVTHTEGPLNLRAHFVTFLNLSYT